MCSIFHLEQPESVGQQSVSKTITDWSTPRAVAARQLVAQSGQLAHFFDALWPLSLLTIDGSAQHA